MTKNFISKTNDQFEREIPDKLTLEEFLETLEENPQYAATAAQYLLNAIEYHGRRTVIEEGEERQRWRFFDNPSRNGKHAVLGNTDLLNSFVDELRLMAEKNTKNDKIIWFEGPTATGKSELKRCLITGLKDYSKTEEGKRFTMEWNVNSRANTRDLSYGSGPTDREDDWYTSPVQDNPLKVFPEDRRDEITKEFDTSKVSGRLDPFCRETYEMLRSHYEDSNEDDIFESMVDEKHLRIRNYTMDLGSGIGVLHSEDDGQPKHRLIGHWMQGMLQELNTRGRKNPQAFSYDGVLSQGNGGVTIFEDASQHLDLLAKMLNVTEEDFVKLDKEVTMDIDTVLMAISNPDMEFNIRQQQERENMDPMKALRRRLSKHKFTYLTSLSSEVQLLRREIANETATAMDDSSKADPLFLDGTEIARHTLEVAAMYSILTRIEKSETPHDLSNVEKILLLDNGHIYKHGEQLQYSDFDWGNSALDGDNGIPVTYTRDIISQVAQEEEIVTPTKVLKEMVHGLSEEPLFSSTEKKTYRADVTSVDDYKNERIEEDVLAAIMRDKRVEEDKVRRYVDMVYEWNAGNEDNYDPLEMKVFETRHFGRFEDNSYDGEAPRENVKEFRTEEVIKGVNSWIRNRSTEDHDLSEINHKEIPVFRSVLEQHSWSDVAAEYEDFLPEQWKDPPNGTETEMLKAKTIENMVDMFDYTEKSAKLASQHVMKDVNI